MKKDAAPTREEDPFDKLPPDQQKVRLWLDVRLSGEVGSVESKTGHAPIVAQRIPHRVLASNPVGPESARHSRDEAGPRLDILSSNTLHITATGSGHEIHL